MMTAHLRVGAHPAPTRRPDSIPGRPLRWAAALVALALTGAAGTDVATASAGVPTPGAPGIGDSLFPELGNGGYDVTHYDLSLRYETGSPDQSLVGTVTLRARSTQSLSRFDLDFAGDSVGSVRVDGCAADHERIGEELVITPDEPIPSGTPFTVTVTDFTSTPARYEAGAPRIPAFVTATHNSLWLGQPNRMHRVFPSNDHPADKATFSFHIDVPEGTTAVANGELRGRATSGGRTVWTYVVRQPMATHVAQVAVGDLTITTQEPVGDVMIRDVTPTELTSTVTPLLRVAGDHLRWMEERVGDYPFSTYGILVSDVSLWTALETQTLTWADLDFFTSTSEELRNSMLVHELAHQWFGNSVAVERWSDIWLSEGHATWYELAYDAESGTLDDISDVSDLTGAMRQTYEYGDAFRQQFGPVAAPTVHDPEEVLNPNAYYGGALVLYALRQEIGQSGFETVERAWVNGFEGRSAGTDDFIALVNEVTGRDLTRFLTDWLYGTTTPPMPGHPDWTVTDPATLAAEEELPPEGETPAVETLAGENTTGENTTGENTTGENTTGETPAGE